VLLILYRYFVFFLRALPMIAALTMQPHKQPDNRKMLYVY